MNTVIKVSIILYVNLILSSPLVFGQAEVKEWNLRNCIDYALQHNIQLKLLQVEVKVNEAGYEQSKAAKIPSLNANANESYTHQQSLHNNFNGMESYFSGNYALNSNVILYNGLKIKNGIIQQELNVKSSELNLAVNQNNTELAVTSAYLQIMYARETVKNAENTLTASQAQVNQAKIQYDAGYIAESNYAQIQAQYSTDSYSLVLAQNNLNQQLLNLKQLLELDISQELNLNFPELNDSDVLKPIPAKIEVYKKALGFMPEIKNGELLINLANLDIKISKAGYLPTLSLSASAVTGYTSVVSNGFSTQLGDNFYQNAGLSLTIPIFNNKLVKTSVSKAKLGLETAQLNYEVAQKKLQNNVESAYLNAISGQSRFQAATEQLKSTNKSYKLVEEQFKLGMKNTVDLLTEKIKYQAAQEEYIQSKYTAILNYKLLDFYQMKKIEL